MLTFSVKQRFPCPGCGQDMKGFEFYDRGYKMLFKCLIKNCCNINDFWLDSYGNITIPHNTWLLRHERKSRLIYELKNSSTTDERKKEIKICLNLLGKEYD
jgi:hypothetical protein